MPSADTHQALRAALEKAGVDNDKIDAVIKALDVPSEKADQPKPRQKASDAFEEARAELVRRRKAADEPEPDAADDSAEEKQEAAA